MNLPRFDMVPACPGGTSTSSGDWGGMVDVKEDVSPSVQTPAKE